MYYKDIFKYISVIPLLRGNAEIRGFEGSAEIRRSEKKSAENFFERKKISADKQFLLGKKFQRKKYWLEKKFQRKKNADFFSNAMK